jgi:argininosuccinate lyase
MGFAPEYVASVLAENFEDAKRLFLPPLMAIHYAHLVMLADRGIMGAGDARLVRDALDGIDTGRVAAVRYDGTYEDLFCYLNTLIESAAGAEAGGRLHTARSRNDIDMTMYRMQQRSYVLSLAGATIALRESLASVAERNRDTVLALHTHTQPAQPSTVAHYLLAALEQLERDNARLAAAYETTNRCPLGACAITGTGFPIDRQLTSDLLGFHGPTGNTYGSIATVDYLLQNVGAASVLLTGLGRLVQDLLAWCTAEFGYMRLGDGFVQGSSIMPQKRNPVALEHARAICSKALGEAIAVTLAVHNTPFGDIVDTEDDLQPLVYQLFHDAARALSLVAAAMATASFDGQQLEARAGEGGTTLTELADTLVRERGVCFQTAHAVAGRVAKAIHDDPACDLADVVRAASRELAGEAFDYPAGRLRAILSPRHFVEVRTTLGGPAPATTANALAGVRLAIDADRRWVAGQREALAAAGERLKERSRRL